MNDRNVIDAEFELVEHRLPRFRWGVFLWWAFYTGCFVVAAYDEQDPQGRALWVFLAACAYPVVSWLGGLFSGLTEKVSDEEAELMRERMLTRPRRQRLRRSGL